MHEQYAAADSADILLHDTPPLLVFRRRKPFRVGVQFLLENGQPLLWHALRHIVVGTAGEGERLLRRDPQRGAERAQRLPLVGAEDVDLDVRGHRAADRDLREKRGQLFQLFFLCAQVAEVHLRLLDAAAAGAEIGLQVLHRRARAVEQLEDAAVRDVVPGPLVHRTADIAPVVLVAVVDHVERVHMVL